MSLFGGLSEGSAKLLATYDASYALPVVADGRLATSPDDACWWSRLVCVVMILQHGTRGVWYMCSL